MAYNKVLRIIGGNMTRKLAVFAVGIVFVGITVFVFSGQMNFPAKSSAQTNVPEVPDYVLYTHLFRHVAALKDKADELERQGGDARKFHNLFKNKADLSDEQAQVLELIASQCALKIKAIDERTKPIIQIYKAQYPNGQVPHGQKPLPPPVALQQLTEERNSLVLRKRDELRNAFGEEAFGHFQEFVKNKIAPNVKTISAEQ